MAEIGVGVVFDVVSEAYMMYTVPFWKIRIETPQANVVRLRHPRTREPASFLHNPESGHLCELLAFGEEHR